MKKSNSQVIITKNSNLNNSVIVRDMLLGILRKSDVART